MTNVAALLVKIIRKYFMGFMCFHAPLFAMAILFFSTTNDESFEMDARQLNLSLESSIDGCMKHKAETTFMHHT
jgi:hypothetical protein